MNLMVDFNVVLFFSTNISLELTCDEMKQYFADKMAAKVEQMKESGKEVNEENMQKRTEKRESQMDEMCEAADKNGDGISLEEYISEMDGRSKRHAKEKRKARGEKQGTPEEEVSMSKEDVDNVVTFSAADINFDEEIDAVESEFVALEEDFEGAVADVFALESNAAKLTMSAMLLVMLLLHPY